ncbi:histidine phosphatase family protein [Patescibacteria group bacterium]|nr:histidine phosphatase family protein [Patescibacteria group bacterium]
MQGSGTIVYLCRHGEFENPENIFHGRLPGFPLSPRGRKQAEVLSRALSGKPIAAVVASPLTRTRETAEIIAKPHHLTVLTDNRLMDIKTPLQGKPLPYMESIHFRFFQPHLIRAGGERLSDVFRRMDRTIRELVRRYRGEEIVVVSHGDPIMSVKFKYGGKPLYTRMPFEKEYIGLTDCLRVTFSPRGKPLRVMVEHLGERK